MPICLLHYVNDNSLTLDGAIKEHLFSFTSANHGRPIQIIISVRLPLNKDETTPVSLI